TAPQPATNAVALRLPRGPAGIITNTPMIAIGLDAVRTTPNSAASTTSPAKRSSLRSRSVREFARGGTRLHAVLARPLHLGVVRGKDRHKGLPLLLVRVDEQGHRAVAFMDRARPLHGADDLGVGQIHPVALALGHMEAQGALAESVGRETVHVAWTSVGAIAR